MFGALIGAAGSLLGGLLGKEANEDAQAAQIAANNAMFEKNAALQKEFAQTGIQWKVQDAEKAGVHPLYAMGAQTHSFAPVAVGSSFSPDTSMASAVSSAGQEIGRAVSASSSVDAKYNAAVKALTLQRGELENTLLASQIAKINQAGVTPPMPAASQRWLVDGQGQTALPAGGAGAGNMISDQPLKRTFVDPGRPHSEPGAIPDVGFARTNTGWAPVPSENVKQRIEDNIIQEVMWAVRNNLLPMFGSNASPPSVKLGPGERMRFNPFRQEYQIQKLRGKYGPVGFYY